MVLEFILANWQWILLGFMILEKIVKITPCKWDDLLVDGLKEVFTRVRTNRSLEMVAIILLPIFMLSCATTMPSVCDNVEESILCDLSRKSGIRLEDIGNGIIIANAVLISQGTYSKEDALGVMETVRLLLDKSARYHLFKKAIEDLVHDFPGLLEVSYSYLEVLDLDSRISPADRLILEQWLDRRIESLR